MTKPPFDEENDPQTPFPMSPVSNGEWIPPELRIVRGQWVRPVPATRMIGLADKGEEREAPHCHCRGRSGHPAQL